MFSFQGISVHQPLRNVNDVNIFKKVWGRKSGANIQEPIDQNQFSLVFFFSIAELLNDSWTE